MRNILLASVASLALATTSVHAQQAVHFDGFTYLTNYGPTPDMVQTGVGFPGPNVGAASSNSVYSVWLRMSSVTGFDVHSYHGVTVPNDYATLLESQFALIPYIEGFYAILYNDPDASKNVSLIVILCDDSNCTNWLEGMADPSIPEDDQWHNLQIYVDPTVGSVDYVLDSSAGGTGGLPPMNVVGWTGPFQEPIAGMFWQVGCDTTWNSPGDTSPQWNTCYAGDMAEVFKYSGPFPVIENPGLISDFYYYSGSLIKASNLGLAGDAVFGDLPSVYLKGNSSIFPDGNAAWFGGSLTPAVLPYTVNGLTDLDGGMSGGLISVLDPY